MENFDTHSAIKSLKSVYTGAEFVRGVTAIASAFLEKNQVPAHEVSSLIRGISKELRDAVLTGASLEQADELGQAPTVAVEAATSSGEPVQETSAAAVDPRRQNLPTEPFVPVSESIKPYAIVCLFDGAEKKMLKRYIRAKYGMEEDEYRAYWGLPADYPMVAPGYAEEKSRVAIVQGLGTSKVAKTPRAQSEDRQLKVA